MGDSEGGGGGREWDGDHEIVTYSDDVDEFCVGVVMC